ncbi:MAG: hypothetical protein EB078_10550 [Proteobacteria bacterium]|nr:hypothetical protein [Pseudomonadota bacterium]NDD05336.1 hypothetical protein [Pseudomonadota bacterium]
MKIKGVTGGKNRGNVVEYTPEEKPEVVVRDHIPTVAPTDELWFATKVDVTSLQHSPKGIGNKTYADNAYQAEGEVVIRVLKTTTDEYLTPRTKHFSVEFEDCLDGNGQPDMKVTKFELT